MRLARQLPEAGRRRLVADTLDAVEARFHLSRNAISAGNQRPQMGGDGQPALVSRGSAAGLKSGEIARSRFPWRRYSPSVTRRIERSRD